MQKLFDDKQIMNPVDQNEVFTCKDLQNGKSYLNLTSIQLIDYSICRKEKRFQMVRKTHQHSCHEYRTLASKCYYMDEEEFIDLMLDNYEKRRKFADYLEAEGSMFAQSAREKQGFFRLRGGDQSVGGQQQ